MKSKLVILSLLLCAGVTASAQTKEKFYSEGKNNWFISVGGGVQVLLNPDNNDYGFSDAITPNITLSLGKWMSPVWGIRGQAEGAWSTLYSKYGRTTGYTEIKNKHYIGLHADGLLNLSNAIAGYNPKRVFNLSVFAGPGLTLAKAFNDQKDINVLINGSVGLLGQFNVSKCLDINIEARGQLHPSPFGVQSSTYTDGAISLTAGLTYTFGGKKFTACGEKIDVDALNAEINKYRQQLSDAERDLAACKNALANVKQPEAKVVTKEIKVAGPRAIFFQIGKSAIDDYGLVNVKLAADIIKANPNKKYKIAGYADSATGSTGWNQKLSERRAQAVHDALVKEGVNGNQLELVGFGGTTNMFGQNKLNRVVIME